MSDNAMASANESLSPQSQQDSANASALNSPTKRKRAEHNAEAVEANGTVDVKPDISMHNDVQDSKQRIDDFVDILKRCDTTPSILDHPLKARDSDSSTEPHAKRKKSEIDSTILTRYASLSYSTLDEIVADIKDAAASIVKDLQLPLQSGRNQYTPTPLATAELAAQIEIFQKKAKNLVEQQKALDRLKDEGHRTKPTNGATHINGALTSNAYNPITTALGDNKVVLTLYGNAPGAKQLFSSLQKPVIEGNEADEVVQPLREAGLPNGITTTQIVPLEASAVGEDKKPVKTIGELFALPAALPPFQPPKSSKLSTTRGSSVGWYQPTAAIENARTRNDQSYFEQPISSGSWLEYSGASSTTDPRRKFRDRALSLSRGKVPSEINSGEQEVEKLETLFRNAYSSFGPSKDDAAAIIPRSLVNRMWWQRVGEKSFERLISNAVNLAAVVKPDPNAMDVSTGNDPNTAEDEDEELKKAVEEWDESMIDPKLEDTVVPAKSIQDKDVEEILQDISELLETLNSYQRIRNLSLNSRPAGSLSVAESPEVAKPTEGEQATYNILKSQLSLMINMLPPYAVAKLNSDQLSELNISTKIQVLTDNHKGVMEDDETTQRAKLAAMTNTASRPTPPTSLHRGSTSSLYGNQYASSVRPGAQQYYSQTQTPIRPPSTGPPRPPSTAPAPYLGPRPTTATSYRPPSGYTATAAAAASASAYAQQLSRSQQYGSQHYQTPSSTSYGQQAYGAVPQTAPQGRYPPSPASFLNRPHSSQNGLDYRYSNGNTNTPRQASPQKHQAYSPNPVAAQPSNRSYGTPTPSVSQDRRHPQAQVSNGHSSLSPQPQTPQGQAGHLGATGYHTVMTPAEQSNMMERQRAQLAQQQGTQHQARNAAQASTMGTSPSKQVNGGNVVAAGP